MLGQRLECRNLCVSGFGLLELEFSGRGNDLKLILIAFFLFSSVAAVAQDHLGTIKALQVDCPAGRLEATRCYALEISCPDIPDYTAYVKIISPSRPQGAIIFTTGGNGNYLYEKYEYGGVAVQEVVSSGYTAVQLTFGAPFSNGPGWQHYAGGKGVRAASCRYATVAHWVYEQGAGRPLCATGNSAGGQNISEGLAHYGLGDYLTFAEITSGPPFNRVDYACIDNVPPATEYCSGSDVGMGVGLGNATDFIDPAYPGPWCSSAAQNHSTLREQLFLSDSVTSPDAVLSYPNTKIRFLFGGQDTTSAIRQGMNYQSRIVQRTTYGCVQDAPHSLPTVLDGAQTIAADLVANCHK